MNDNGQLLIYEEFLSVCGFPVTPREYSTVFDVIPDGVSGLLLSAPKGMNCIIPGLSPDDIFIGKVCPLLSDEATNRCITVGMLFREVLFLNLQLFSTGIIFIMT